MTTSRYAFKEQFRKLSPDAREQVKAQMESGKMLVIAKPGIKYTSRRYTISCGCGYSGEASIVVINLESGETDMYCGNCGDM